MRRGALALVACLGLACASVSPPADVDAPRREALVEGDVAALEVLLADGMRYGHANGEVQTKQELIAALASGRIDYRAIRLEAGETHEVAGALVVTGRQTVEVTAEGRAVTSHSAFSAVYARDAGRWRLVAYQSAPVGP